jgi:hypothetical protein
MLRRVARKFTGFTDLNIDAKHLHERSLSLVRMRTFLLAATLLAGCFDLQPEPPPPLQLPPLPQPQPPRPTPPYVPACGDGVCSTGEAISCPIDCPTPPVCNEDPQPESLSLDLTGTTVGGIAQDDRAPCGDGEPGLARTYSWSAAQSGSYTIAATADFPIIVDVRRGSCEGSDLTCDAAQATDATSAIVALYAGQRIQLVLDGEGGSSGTFHLTIVRNPDSCGDGVCEAGEACDACAADCGTCPPPPVCGDGVCEAGENDATCSSDCGSSTSTSNSCGDGICDATETSASCPIDCSSTTTSTCGDGFCDAGESSTTCPSDCSDTTESYCGDGSCDAGEDSFSCPSDCGSPPSYCGDGSCDAGEDSDSCPSDC